MAKAKGVELASAYVSLSVNTSGIPDQIKKALNAGGSGAKGAGNKVGNDFASGFGQNLEAGMTKAAKLGVTAAAGVATAAVGGLSYTLFKGFDRYKSLDATNKRLRAMGKSGDQVKSIIGDINSVVEGTPISLDAAAASATQFLAGGVKEGKELKNVLTSIADAAGFSGQSYEDLALIFGQVMNKGKLQAEEMLQLNERNIPIQQWLQKELGVTGQELQRMSQNGQVSFQNLVDAVESNAPGMAKALGDTVDGALSNMKAAVGRVGANIFSAIFGDPLSTGDGPGAMAAQINKVTDRLKDMNTWVADNGDAIVDWTAMTATGMTYLGETVTAVVAGVTRGLAVFVNAFGDTLGAMTRGVAAVNRLLGRTEIADQLDGQADAMFGLADSLNATEDRMYGLAKSIGGMRDDISSWKEQTKQAAQFTEALGTAAGKIAPQNWWGTTIIKAPTADEVEKIRQAGFEVKQIPGTKDVEIVAVTEQATNEMNAWRDKQGQQPVVPPVQPDLTGANATMQSFFDQWSNAVINPQVQVPGGGVPGSNPLDIFAPTGSGGLLGGGGNAPAPGPGALPSSIGGGGRPGGPTAGFPNAAGASGPGRLFGPAGNNVKPAGSYGLAKGTDTGGYGSSGPVFPSWVHDLERAFGVKASTYSGHQESNRNEAGYAPNPLGLNRGIDWSGSPQAMQRFADYLKTVPGMEQVIWNGAGIGTGDTVEIAGGRPQPGYFSGDLAGHGNHVHTRQSTPIPLPRTYDTGGWLPPGVTMTNNATGQHELILNPDQIQQLQDQGIDPNTLLHGQAQGAPPGPQQQQPNPSNRTGGYIPATAGNTNPVGQGGLSSILGLGESFVNNLIDTGAQAASMAATAAAGAASFGAGAAAGPGASTAISMGAEALKRGVSWGFDMASIWGEALPEIFMPFGVPRWLGQVDPMAFVPQTPGQQPGQQPGGGAAAQQIQSWAQPGNPAMANGTGQQGAQAALAEAKQQPSYQAAAQAPQQTPPPTDPFSALLKPFGVFDNGGWLPPGGVGVNLSNRPEAVFTGQQFRDMSKMATSWESTPARKSGDTYQFYAQDVEGMFREYQKNKRRESRQYSGRP